MATGNNDNQSKKQYARFKYSEESIAQALEKIKSGDLSLNKASIMFNIPKSTLHNKIHNKVPNIRKMGPQPVLTPFEEERIESWIVAKAKLGFPMHAEEVKDAVQKILKDLARPNPFTNGRPGDKWLQLFLKRHPLIDKKNTEVISKSRAAVTEQSLREWFSELNEFIKANNLIEMISDPSRVFNADETGMRTSMKSGKVLGPKKFKNLYEISCGSEKESITVLCNYSARGDVVPPMVVFPYKRIRKELVLSIPEGWAIGRSDSGWMTGATFFEYIANVFYPWLVKQNFTFPVILFIDGHKSHYNIDLYEFCIDKKIILYCLLPNATHIIQPCDVSIFRPLKSEWKKACRLFKQKSGTAITRYNFCLVFKEAFVEANKVETIQNGFRACGLYPLNANAVDYSKCISTRREELFSKETNVHNCSTSEDFKSTLKVVQQFLGDEKMSEYKSKYSSNEHFDDTMYLFWKFCHEQIAIEAQCANNVTNEIEELFTEEYLDTLPFEIDGVLCEDNNTPSAFDITNHNCDIVGSMSYNEAESDCEPGTRGTLDQSNIKTESDENNIPISPNCKTISNFKFEVELGNTTDTCLSFENKTDACISFENKTEICSTRENKTDKCISSETKTHKCISPKNDTNAENDDNDLFCFLDKDISFQQSDNVLKNQGSNKLLPIANYSDQERESEETDANPIKNGCNTEKSEHNLIQQNNYSHEECEINRPKIDILSNIVIREKNTDVFDKHLYWPKPENTTKRNKKATKMPYAITSTQWLKFQQEQEEQKHQKEENVKKRKLERQEKKESKKQNTKKKKNNNSNFRKGDYVVVIYEDKLYPGVIKNLNNDSEEYEVSVLEEISNEIWKWPKPADRIWYTKDEVLRKIPKPKQETNGTYTVQM